jgi:hypothetical protein
MSMQSGSSILKQSLVSVTEYKLSCYSVNRNALLFNSGLYLHIQTLTNKHYLSCH